MNLTAALGAASLLTALATSLFAVGAAVWHVRAPARGWDRTARRALLVTAALTTLAVATLAFALLRNDFSLAYVASVSSRAMEPELKWASLYGAQPGSLLFWTWALSLFVAAFAWRTLPGIGWGAGHVAAVCGALLAAFLAAAAFLASPFEVSRVTPADGVGLNPLLVDRGMLIHPPFLLSGLVSTAIPFALGMGALLAGRIDHAWIRAARSWALLSWLVLSVGNFLGGWWAYTVLGWGGYWGWDPVENSAILPLLPMTAFLHSMMVQERRGMLKLWNLGLVIAAFALAVFGTFNVRSGLVESVHSFARSDVGAYFLVLLALVVAVSVALMVWRAPRLAPGHDFESLASRETALILNNYVLTAIALVVLGGTLFPVFSELIDGSRITVGPSFFNRVVGPLLIALLVLISIGTVVPWRRAANATLAQRFRTPALVLAASAIALAAWGMRDPFALATTAAAVVLLIVTLREFAVAARWLRRGTGRSWPAAALGIFQRDSRRYGGFLVHLGIAVMAIAVVGSTMYQEQVRATVAPGESFVAGGRTLTYEGLRERSGLSNGIETEVIAPLAVTRDGRAEGRLTPGRRLFANFPQQPTAIISVDSSLRDDLYVFVQGWDGAGVAEFNVFVNPLINFLWIGAGIYIVGGIIAFAPRRAAVAVRAEAPRPALPQRA